MFFKQFYLACLAHASYLIGSDGEAAVVDPQRDVDEYIAEARAHQLNIKYIIETHLHADFVSGHQELAKRLGATIVFGQKAGASFAHQAVKDGDEIKLGKLILRFLETPGHTPESICVLVIDPSSSEQPQKILTGDTLFIGDVGRPDLAGGKGFTPQQMAGLMYESLHGKLLTLPDETEVYPAHGAGSMCGKNMSKETSSTIGEQRKFNYALKPMSKDEFVQMMTADLPEAPAYFPKDAEINRSGARGLSEIVPPRALSVKEVTAMHDAGHVILDIRSADIFGAGHVAGSINIGLGGQFAMWAGSLLAMTSEIVIVAETNAQVDESLVRLARVGIENVRGYLIGDVNDWVRDGLSVSTIKQYSVSELKDRIASGGMTVIDVRRPAEYAGGHVPGAFSFTLSGIDKHVSELPFDRNSETAVICAGGYRSSAAASMLEKHGFTKLINITGGTNAWVKSGFPVES
jgi:glyoxylase-like metal-dependent hydrolase (beta-lactamase superfamily II)/rhodanese-related sulfurtransferase